MQIRELVRHSNFRSIHELALLPDEAVIAPGELALLENRSVETLRRWRRKGIGPSYLKAVGRPDGAEYQMGAVRRWQGSRQVLASVKPSDPSIAEKKSLR